MVDIGSSNAYKPNNFCVKCHYRTTEEKGKTNVGFEYKYNVCIKPT